MKKEYRVKKGSEIEAIIKHRQSAGNKYFVVYTKKNHEQSHFRFAVSVPKKYGNAVERNKIKRQIREVIAKYGVVDVVDIFIVVKSTAKGLSFQSITETLTNLIDKQLKRGESK
ncbi:ribonuclease P protein component [Candidatus Xianfuyuplasma coldseepsis]|uniref:Ribonuclease P protein component n=1 Tax=Candidatus Xianfuyuplasma coldseepsis TaxID=2782163 RepID=A0A7L7KQE7_9MOLU|nr:ribonuclease P protein component [Xianfuyuplasma coldseepsis]QMS84943.1 ribonuclease P protein component [Xianfuyuplasma coldseepsis]